MTVFDADLSEWIDAETDGGDPADDHPDAKKNTVGAAVTGGTPAAINGRTSVVGSHLSE